MIGSQGYSPIEQMKSGEAYPASDLFGLGATCFHLLTGVHPFNLWVENGYAWVDDWQKHLPNPVSRELSEILNKLLKRDFAERYQSADEVIEDLTPKPSPPPQKSSVPQRAPVKNLPQQFSKLTIILGIIVLVITMLGGLSGYLWRQGSSTQTEEPKKPQVVENSKKTEPTLGANAKRLAQIDKGWLIYAKAKLDLSKGTLPPADNVPAQPLPIFAPPASLLQVVQKQQISSSQDYWLRIKVCSVGDAEGAINPSTLLKAGEQIWLKSSQLTPSNVSIADPTTASDLCSTADSLAPAIEDSSTSVPVEDSFTPQLIQPKPGNIPGSTPLPTPNG